MKRLIFLLLAFVLLQACSSTKYVPENEELLFQTKVKVDKPELSKSELKAQMRQQPNHRFLGLFNMDLALYNLSGQDTSKWVNRFLRKIGDAPVIYDEHQSERSQRAMEQYLFNRGYFNASVDVKADHLPKQKVKTLYSVKAGAPYSFRQYHYDNNASALDSIIHVSMKQSDIKQGKPFNSDLLNAERSRLVNIARNQGYYAINRDHFSYLVDSAVGHRQVDVNLQLKPYTRMVTNEVKYEEHQVYTINKVYFLLDVQTSSFSRAENRFMLSDYDTLQIAENNYMVYRNEPFLSPKTLLQQCFIEPGSLYRVDDVSRTYTNFNQIECLKYVNIRFLDVSAQEPSLDVYIVLSPNPYHVFSIDVEGTNTAGDLGAALLGSYMHQNIFGGGEVFNINARGAYEALSASFSNDYWEYGGELQLAFPDLLFFPDKKSSKTRSASSTTFSLNYDNLARPEFWRTTAALSMEYAWQNPRVRQNFNPIDFAYTHMPEERIDSAFKANYLKEGSYLRYSYEDQFIVSSSYGISYSSIPTGLDKDNRRYYTLRANVESAGNLLYLAYKQLGRPDDEGQYNIGKIPFSQYLKAELEATRHIPITENIRLAARAGVGVAYPYGNSKILPFEKRFYSGGANSVRGWSVRRLGPGSFRSPLSGIDFMNQSGDVKLDLNLELRHKWFWLLEGAYFIDAGNIWTLRNYDNQPGGQFHWNHFYEEIACSVGMGIRLNFNFFLIRIDGGMKVYDPSGLTSDERWRIKHIDSWNDFAAHIAIGYPF